MAGNMQSVRRLSLHKHMKADLRRKRYSHSSPAPLSSILENQLFNSKAGVAYIVSLIGCLAYNYLHIAKQATEG